MKSLAPIRKYTRLLIAFVALACQTTKEPSNADPNEAPLPELASGEIPLKAEAMPPLPTPTPTPVETVVPTVPIPEKISAQITKAKSPIASKPKRQGNQLSPAVTTPQATPPSPPSPTPSPQAARLQIPDSEDYRLCKIAEIRPQQMTRDEAYKDSIFQAGERATYEVFYGGVLGGYGTIEVDSPILIDGLWHRVLKADAYTGDWFKAVFVGKYKILSWSRPWDFGIRRFYMETDEGKLFGSRTEQKKWVEFDHGNCAGHEKTQRKGKPEKIVDTQFNRASTDVLGAYFALRSRKYRIGKIEYVPVYTGEKNWTLEATPIATEEIETAAGKFTTTRLKLLTYIGQELQQKGDVHIWIAENLKERILVQVKADVKVGSIYVKLKEFHSGAQ